MKDILHHKMQDSFFSTILKIQNPAFAGFYILQSTKQEQKIKKFLMDVGFHIKIQCFSYFNSSNLIFHPTNNLIK